MEMMLLSLNSPAVHEAYPPGAVLELAKCCNDYLTEQIAKQPRFRGLAALPRQDPEPAIAELEHCTKELGFLGILVNGFSQVDCKDSAIYLEASQYKPFWQT